MTEYYDREEKKLEDIIHNHVHSVDENSIVHLNVYYINLKIKKLTHKKISTQRT